MGSKRIFSLPTFVTVVGLWTALSSGRPAPPPLPAELYTLNDSYPNYHLGPVSESRSGVWVNVVTATPLSCAWLINGSQPHQPFVAYQNSSSILLQPFDQNFRNTNITCINLKNSTERYNFTIGDVYACPDSSPSVTVDPTATVSAAGDSSTPPSGPTTTPSGMTTPPSGPTITPSGMTTSPSGPIISPSGMTTSPSGHPNSPSATPTHTPSDTSSDNTGVIVGVLSGIAVIIFIIVTLACLGWWYRRNRGNAGGQGGAHDATGGGADPVEETGEGGPPQMQSAGSGQPSEAVQESGRQSPSAVMCLHNCEVTIGGSSTSRGINTGHDEVDVPTEDKRPIPETQKPLGEILRSARPASEMELLKRGYEITSSIQFFLKSSCSQQKDPPHSSTLSTQSSGYDQIYDDANAFNCSDDESNISQSLIAPLSSLLVHPPLSTPPSSLASPPPSSPSSSTSSSTAGDSGVDVADEDTEEDGCIENSDSEWEEAALPANCVEESTVENMIAGQEINQELHESVDDDEIEGGYVTTVRPKRLLIRAKGAHTKKKDRLVGIISTQLGSSFSLMYTPPSKWKAFKGNVDVELVHGINQFSTGNHTQEVICC